MANPTCRNRTTYRVAYRFPFDGYRGQLGPAVGRHAGHVSGVFERNQKGAEMTTPCPTCADGMAPTRVIRIGRAHYCCAGCGRDVSMIMWLMADADLDVIKVER